MKRERVRSSNIQSVGYDPTAATLEVEFINSGIYQYFSVPQQLYQRFMAARSKGQFFSGHIRDKFRTEKIQ